MKQILITGATGNVGTEVIISLLALKTGHHLKAGVRDVEKSRELFPQSEKLDFVQFDFEDSSTHDRALHNIDIVFLLRPPQISDVKKVFEPLIGRIKNAGASVVFLSVQGVETSSVIPHHKIEKLITDAGIDHILVRPSYFMQNLTTTLLKDIREKGKITLPAGRAKFLWVDAKDIGEATAKLIQNFDKYKNQAFEITGTEKLNFEEVSDILTQVTGKSTEYKSVNPFSFYFRKKKEGMKSGFILVMTLLHFLPRFQSEPEISESYSNLTGKNPTSLREFIKREISTLTGK